MKPIDIDFTSLREYGNGFESIHLSLNPEVIERTRSITPKQYRSLMIALSIRTMIYLLTGYGLEEVATKIELIAGKKEKSLRFITGNLLKLSKRLGDL